MSHEWHKKGLAITFCKALFLLFYISLCDILYYISSCNIVHHSQEEHRSALLDGVYERTVDYELHAGHVQLGLYALPKALHAHALRRENGVYLLGKGVIRALCDRI